MFDRDNIFFYAWDYGVSYLEFFGLVSGIVAVTLSAYANVWNWPVGLVNVILSFVLFYQVQLYPDMFLQVFYFVTNLIGWWRWTHPGPGEEDRRHELKISLMSRRELLLAVAVGAAGTMAFGLLAGNLHELLPELFPVPGAYPFLDSFITVMSILATWYAIQKKVECWIIWLAVDILATWLYFVRDIRLYSLLYFGFCLLAAFALYKWIALYRLQGQAR